MLRNIGKLKRQNSDMRFLVNVYRIVDKNVFVKELARDEHADITGVEKIYDMLIIDPNGVNGHFILIKNFNALIRKFYVSSRHYFCLRCCSGLVRAECSNRCEMTCRNAVELTAILLPKG